MFSASGSIDGGGRGLSCGECIIESDFDGDNGTIAVGGDYEVILSGCCWRIEGLAYGF